MKRSFARVVALSMSVLSLAAVSAAQQVKKQSLARDAEAADVYVNAHRAQSLADGSRFIIYRSPVPREPSALAAAFITPGGAVTRMKAADWVPPEELFPETIGQIYAAALSPDGSTLVVSIGWRHVEEGGTNALAILLRSGGDWELSHLLRGLGGTGDLLLTKSRLLLALTAAPPQPEASGRLPQLLTVLTLDGRILLEALPAASAGPDLAVYRNRSRLAGGDGAFTLFDAERGTVSFFELTNDAGITVRKPGTRDVPVAVESKPSVGIRVTKTVTVNGGSARPDPNAAIIEDAHVYADGTVAVVRSLRSSSGSRVGTHVVLQSPDGKNRSWNAGAFWKPIFWENDRLIGIARGETPEHDLIVNSVTFE